MLLPHKLNSVFVSAYSVTLRLKFTQNQFRQRLQKWIAFVVSEAQLMRLFCSTIQFSFMLQ